MCGALPVASALADAAQAATADEAVAGADAARLEQVMALLAEGGGIRAEFEETRHLQILTEPIETRGVLYFAPPDRLARHTTYPGHSRLVVNGDQAAFRDETGQQALDLGTSEVARGLVGNLMVLLRGDLAGLRSRYSVSFRADGPRWVLELAPRSRELRSVIDRQRVIGNGRVLLSLESWDPGGDRTLTHFDDVETGLAWSAAEADRIFSLEGFDAAP